MSQRVNNELQEQTFDTLKSLSDLYSIGARFDTKWLYGLECIYEAQDELHDFEADIRDALFDTLRLLVSLKVKPASDELRLNVAESELTLLIQAEKLLLRGLDELVLEFEETIIDQAHGDDFVTLVSRVTADIQRIRERQRHLRNTYQDLTTEETEAQSVMAATA